VIVSRASGKRAQDEGAKLQGNVHVDFHLSGAPMTWEIMSPQENNNLSNPPGKRILIVEDEALVAMMIEDMVIELGHNVAGVVARLKDGLQRVEQGEIDFAILDVSLNGERSLPIAEALEAKGVPYVFATGYGAGGIDSEKRRGLTLSKPFGIEDLRRVLPKA
jgi:CheY-like chemotaxis protein